MRGIREFGEGVLSKLTLSDRLRNKKTQSESNRKGLGRREIRRGKRKGQTRLLSFWFNSF